MRITVITGQFPCISETFVVDHIVGLIQHGHDVQILSMERPAAELTQPEISQYDLLARTQYLECRTSVYRTDLLRAFMAALRVIAAAPLRALRVIMSSWPFSTKRRRVLRLIHALHCAEPDLVHCHFGHNGVIAIHALEIFGKRVPVVTSFHGIDVDTKIERCQYAQMFELGECFIANSEFTKKRLIGLGCTEAKIVIVPVGVNLADITYTTKMLPHDAIRMVTVARLVECKGLHVALRAVAQIKRCGTRIHYRIIGAGHLRSSLESMAVDLGIENEVEFMGAQTRTRAMSEIAASDLFVLPSIEYRGETEAQGLVIQEAQAAGVPVIASKVGGITDAVVHDETGLLFSPGDSDGLMLAIVRLMQHAALYEHVRKNARNLIERKYDNGILATRLQDIYRDIVNTDVNHRLHK